MASARYGSGGGIAVSMHPRTSATAARTLAGGGNVATTARSRPIACHARAKSFETSSGAGRDDGLAGSLRCTTRTRSGLESCACRESSKWAVTVRRPLPPIGSASTYRFSGDETRGPAARDTSPENRYARERAPRRRRAIRHRRIGTRANARHAGGARYVTGESVRARRRHAWGARRRRHPGVGPRYVGMERNAMFLSTRGSLGRPSTFSPTMLRCT